MPRGVKSTTDENTEMDPEILKRFQQIETRLENILSSGSQLRASCVNETVNRGELFLRILAATHQGVLSNEYSDIMNHRRGDKVEAQEQEMRDIFDIALRSFAMYESLLSQQADGTD